MMQFPVPSLAGAGASLEEADTGTHLCPLHTVSILSSLAQLWASCALCPTVWFLHEDFLPCRAQAEEQLSQQPRPETSAITSQNQPSLLMVFRLVKVILSQQ